MLIICILLPAQNTNDTLLLDKKLSFNTFQYWKYMNSIHSKVQPGISFDVVKFPQNFYIGGFTYKIRGGYFPFYVNLGMIRNNFTFSKIDSPLYPHSSKNPIRREGYNISLSVCQPFHYKRISEIIVPYFDFGYQWGNVEYTYGSNLWESSQINLSSWTWKAGVNIFIDNFPVNFVLEYEQSTKKDRMFNVFSLGVFVDINRTKKNADNINSLIDN